MGKRHRRGKGGIGEWRFGYGDGDGAKGRSEEGIPCFSLLCCACFPGSGQECMVRVKSSLSQAPALNNRHHLTLTRPAFLTCYYWLPPLAMRYIAPSLCILCCTVE